MRERSDVVLYAVFLQKHRQQVEAEQSKETALRRQLEEVQQAKQEAAQVESVTSPLFACCTLGTNIL